ncbi:MAG TPA: ABC transporter transmembrane domain-containing protein [Gemmatimonadaceae bacterium]|nr:ABC transporter transmembrane domain-containing protein [Gemmatimonadaceae bacterium]
MPDEPRASTPSRDPMATPATVRVIDDAARRRIPSPRVLRPLLPRVRPHTGKLTIAGITLVLSAIAGLAFPQVVRYLLDAAFVARDGALLDRIALGLVALFAVQGILTYVQVYALSATGELVIARLREDLFAHLVRLSPGFFADRRTGELTSRLSSDVTMLQSVLSHQMSELARQSLYLVGGVTLLMVTHPRLTITTLAVIPIIVGTAWVFGRALRRASTGVQDRVAEATGTAEEAFSQIRTVQSFTREAEESRRYADHLRDVVLAALRRAKLRGLFFGVISFVAFGGVAAVLWQGGRLVLTGTLTAGALVSFLLYAIYVAAAVGALASLFGTYQEAIGAARRVFELLATSPTVAEPAAPATLPRPARGDVRLERVSFAYAPDLPDTLHEVSLHLAPGEVVALVGPSGAGKTTVASLIPRFWDVTAGRITLDGIDVRSLRLGDLRGAIGIVPQEPALFSGTVRENIAYARAASDEEVIAAARAAHAWEFIERLPDGLDTRVGERGVKLSGGQRQRIAIARVFLKNPAVVVLDEATSSLDSESERLVEAAMEDLLRSRTTLIIAHRLSTVRRADRVVVLDRGRVVEEGTHAALLAEGGVYARLYEVQFGFERESGIGNRESGLAPTAR